MGCHPEIRTHTCQDCRSENPEVYQMATTRTVQRGGTTYTMNTYNIGLIQAEQEKRDAILKKAYRVWCVPVLD